MLFYTYYEFPAEEGSQWLLRIVLRRTLLPLGRSFHIAHPSSSPGPENWTHASRTVVDVSTSGHALQYGHILISRHHVRPVHIARTFFWVCTSAIEIHRCRHYGVVGPLEAGYINLLIFEAGFLPILSPCSFTLLSAVLKRDAELWLDDISACHLSALVSIPCFEKQGAKGRRHGTVEDAEKGPEFVVGSDGIPRSLDQWAGDTMVKLLRQVQVRWEREVVY